MKEVTALIISNTKRAYKRLKKVVLKVKTDEIPKEAAALTFITVLSFVPFLMLIFFIIPDIPGLDIREYLQELFLSILLPDSVEAGSFYVTRLLEQKIPSNIFNVALLIVTSFTLFKFINSSFDKVLNAKELVKKSIFHKISKFVAMIGFGFVFIFVLFSSTSLSMITRIFDLPIIRNVSFIIIPFILFFLVNSLIYIFATSIRIKPKSLVIGSVCASFLWIIAKFAFDYYIANLTNMELVFGFISAVPIFLFWIYLNWIIILLGVVIIAALEKERIAEMAQTENGEDE